MFFAIIACLTMVLIDRHGFRFPSLMVASNSTQNLGATHLANVTPTATVPFSASPAAAAPLPSPTAPSAEGFRSYLPLATPTNAAETVSCPSASTTSSITPNFATPTAVQPTGLVSRPQSTASQPGSAYRKTVLTTTKAYDVAARCLINTLRSVLASLLCWYGFVCRNIVFNTSKAYDVSPLCLIIAFLLGLTSPLCLYGLVVCLPFGEIASKRLKFWVHQSMGCDVACSIEQTGSAYHSGACKIHGLLPPAGSGGLRADTASELETSSCLAHDEGVLAGDAGTCVPRASRAGDFDVSSKEKVGEVRIPGSQDKVDGFHDEDFGSQTMIRGYGGTSPQSRDASRRWQREQPGDPHMAHRSQQSALESYDIVHSSQGTTSNTQLSCDRTLISPVSGRDAVTLPSPPVDHSNMSPVSSPSSILSSGSSLRTLVDSKSSLGGSHTDEALPNNFKSLDTQIQSTESIRHSEKHDPSVEATLSKSNADKNLHDQLFFLPFPDWFRERVDPILKTLFTVTHHCGGLICVGDT